MQKRLKQERHAIESFCERNESIKRMSKVLGKATAVVVVAESGDPLDHESGQHWIKNMGLNLKERSSGKYKGQLKITKRGSGRTRRWLYMTVLRMIQNDEVIRTWYHRKIVRDGGRKKKALVAIMRKLVKALWHVARGETFDSRKLYDTNRLGLYV